MNDVITKTAIRFFGFSLYLWNKQTSQRKKRRRRRYQYKWTQRRRHFCFVINLLASVFIAAGYNCCDIACMLPCFFVLLLFWYGIVIEFPVLLHLNCVYIFKRGRRKLNCLAGAVWRRALADTKRLTPLQISAWNGTTQHAMHKALAARLYVCMSSIYIYRYTHFLRCFSGTTKCSARFFFGQLVLFFFFSFSLRISVLWPFIFTVTSIVFNFIANWLESFYFI